MADRNDASESGVNVKVCVRCRPVNEMEKTQRARKVVACRGSRQVLVTQSSGKKCVEKTFTFDHVFGENSTQADLFDTSVRPLVDEVLKGFNCTIFAYGQTGTGKTHTMEGEFTKDGGHDVHAGVIPRAIEHIYANLEQSASEYTVRASFLELYNEELCDLLAPEEAEPKRKSLRLCEDPSRNGVLVQGLNETIVQSSADVYQIIDSARRKRRVAETLMNKQSSRSHTVFTITLHMKEATPDGEDLLKVGKLNLVDLAGSECLARSGGEKVKARKQEAGAINQSLLTLGRVITALVDHMPHVPYRESKLTRLLQDSLGGRTKTCIVATISPASNSVEETLSTLDYAHRAKNIQNRPEVNQRMTKRALIREYNHEIDRLRRELDANRSRNGVYLPQESYAEMQEKMREQEEGLREKEDALTARLEELENARKLFEDKNSELEETSNMLMTVRNELESTISSLVVTQQELEKAHEGIEEREVVIEEQSKAEGQLFKQASVLKIGLEQSVEDIGGLYSKIQRKSQVEQENLSIAEGHKQTLHGIAREGRERLAAFSTASSAIRARASAAMQQAREAQSAFEQAMSAISTNEEAACESALAEVGTAAASGEAAVGSAAADGVAAVEGAAQKMRAVVRERANVHEGVVKAAGELAAKFSEELSQALASLHGALDELNSAANSFESDSRAHWEAAEQEAEAFERDATAALTSVRETEDAFEAAEAEREAEMRQELQRAMEALVSDYAQKGSERRAARAAERRAAIQAVEGQIVSHSANVRDAGKSAREREEAMLSAARATTSTGSSAASAIKSAEETREEADASHRVELASHSSGFMSDIGIGADNICSVATEAANTTRAASGRARSAVAAAGDRAQAALSQLRTATVGAAAAASDATDKTWQEAATAAEDGESAAKAITQEISSSFERIATEADSLVREKLRTDVPTGQTPVKREIELPRTLSRSMSRESIIMSHRERRSQILRAASSGDDVEKHGALTEVDVEDVVVVDESTVMNDVQELSGNASAEGETAAEMASAEVAQAAADEVAEETANGQDDDVTGEAASRLPKPPVPREEPVQDAEDDSAGEYPTVLGDITNEEASVPAPSPVKTRRRAQRQQQANDALA